jgi:hypothetical protein
LPGWKRFDAAQKWLDQHNNNNPDANSDQSAAGQAPEVGQSATSTGLRSAAGAEQPPPPQESALYQEFLKWRQVRGR